MRAAKPSSSSWKSNGSVLMRKNLGTDKALAHVFSVAYASYAAMALFQSIILWLCMTCSNKRSFHDLSSQFLHWLTALTVTIVFILGPGGFTD